MMRLEMVLLLLMSTSTKTAFAEVIPDWCQARKSDLIQWIEAWHDNNSGAVAEKQLNMAWLYIKNEQDTELNLYTTTEECEKCTYTFTSKVSPTDVTHLSLSSTYKQFFNLTNLNSSICQLKSGLEEGGVYWMIVSKQEDQCCLLLTENPADIYMPILYLFLLFLGLALIYTLCKLAIRKDMHRKILKWKSSGDLTNAHSNHALELSDNDIHTVGDAPITEKPKPAPRRRLRSLDTFRGISLVIMIFVNYGGGGYAIFGHVPWNGLAIADLVFPWFVFIMGTSMAFAFKSLLKKGATRLQLFVKVFRRSLLLFAIGIILNSKRTAPTTFDDFRIFGVMQRLALSYFLAALPEAAFTRLNQDEYKGKSRHIADLLESWPQWLVNLSYLAVYLALTFALPVPGCPTGYLGPGGLHEYGRYFNCSGGAAGYIDRVVLTNSHIYNWPTFRAIYSAPLAMDPEGILGTLCAAFMCFLGIESGRIIQNFKTPTQRLIRWIIWGVISGVIGTILCKASKNDGWIPINKNLWSLSFTLTLSAMAFILLALLYIIIDIIRIWDGQPFYYPGMNSLVIYICHTVFSQYLPVTWYVPPDHWRHLLMDTWGAAVWVFVGYFMYRKKIFIAL